MPTTYKAGDVLKLPDGEIYLVVANKEDEIDNQYYECIGLTNAGELNIDDVSFFEIKNDNGTELIKRVPPTSEKFADLSKLAILEELMKLSPEIQRQVKKILNEEQ